MAGSRAVAILTAALEVSGDVLLDEPTAVAKWLKSVRRDCCVASMKIDEELSEVGGSNTRKFPLARGLHQTDGLRDHTKHIMDITLYVHQTHSN